MRTAPLKTRRLLRWISAPLGFVLVTSSALVFPSSLTQVATTSDSTELCAKLASEDGGPVAESEDAAQALAQQCAVLVEVLAEATEDAKVFALPTGEFELRTWATPQWTRKHGSWVEIDTNLVVGDDGMARPVAAAADVTFSLGGSGPFVRMASAGADFTLSWPEPLPPGIIDGDSIIYPGVYPDVDLLVRAERTGFTHLLVVHTPAAAENPVVRRTEYKMGGSAQVTEEDGGIVVSGPTGMLATAPPAVAWDSPPADGPAGFSIATDVMTSSSVGPSDGATVSPVEVKVGPESLMVVADPKVFDSPHYPVYIDPTYGEKWATWAPTSSLQPNAQWTSGSSWPRENARVGSNYDQHADRWRSHFRFNTSVLRGKRITGTPSVDAYLIHTGHCAGERIGIWQTSSIANHTPTWNGMSSRWLHGGPLQVKTGKANSSTCGQSANYLKFDGSQIKHHVQRHADSDYSSITFGLRMETESSGHWARFDPNDIALKVTYEHKPHSPVATRSSPGGNCHKTSPGPWINNRTPTLYGKASDGDGTVKVQFDVSGPSNPSIHTSAWTNSGKERSWKTPTLTEGNYRWRVRGTDGVDDPTSWTSYCYFRLDHTGPTTPRIERISGTPVVGQPVTLRFTASDARSGVKRFAYGIGIDAKDESVSSSGTTTVTFTPEPGRTVVYVWAQDHAANYSARATFNFFTGRITEAEPRAAWRFDGDLLDDSGQDHHLVVEDGVGYGPDRNGHVNAALTFDGSACAVAPPIVRTDTEFTITAWVKLDDKNSYHTVVQQVGSSRYAVSLHYADTADRWRLTVTQGPDSNDGFTILDSITPPSLGVWQHLAGMVDPVAEVMRLYVDGVLVGERDLPVPPWNAESRFLIGCAGSAIDTWDRLTGSVDHVGVWQGLLSEGQIARAASELPAGLIGDWSLRGDGADGTRFARDLVNLPTDPSWVDDQYGRAESAIELEGTECVSTDVPVVRTDESFTVAAWVRPEHSDANMSLLIQQGQKRSAFKLQRVTDGHWVFSMPSSDDDDALWFGIASQTPAPVGEWRHVVGVYDATDNTIRLYVDGERQGTSSVNMDGWLSAGPLFVGCTASSNGFTQEFLSGAVSGVRAWRGALTDAEVAAVRGGNPPVTLQAFWPLDGPASDEPTYLTDVSGNQHDLSVDGAYSWVRDRGFGRDGALGLELADGSCAETAVPVVRTDESFTISAWVLLEETTDHHTVVSQAGGLRGGFYLKYHPTADRWQFEMPSSPDDSNVQWRRTQSEEPPVLGKWTHLAGVYDLGTNTLRLYVDGELQDETSGPESPFLTNGPTLIGCTGATDGTRWSPLGGVVDDVRIWTSTLDPDRIADLAAG